MLMEFLNELLQLGLAVGFEVGHGLVGFDQRHDEDGTIPRTGLVLARNTIG